MLAAVATAYDGYGAFLLLHVVGIVGYCGYFLVVFCGFKTASPLVDELLKVVGQRRGEVHLLLGGRMPEAECLGMESLAWT